MKLKSSQTKNETEGIHALQKDHFSSFFKDETLSKTKKNELN